MYQTMLHLTDLNETHFHMCQQAVNIATHFKAKLIVLHVIEPPTSLQIAQGLGFAEFEKPVLDDARLVLQALGDALQIPNDCLLVEVGSIKEHAIATIQHFKCELLIIGQHRHQLIPHFLESSARELNHLNVCDILTLKEELT